MAIVYNHDIVLLDALIRRFTVEVFKSVSSASSAFNEFDQERLKSYLAMWQDLIDSGAAWELQGAYGRQVADLIRRGLCRPPPGVKLREGGS